MQFFGARYVFSVQPGSCYKGKWLELDPNHHHLVLWSEWELYVHCVLIFMYRSNFFFKQISLHVFLLYPAVLQS
jgi:hypothetical protein